VKRKICRVEDYFVILDSSLKCRNEKICTQPHVISFEEEHHHEDCCLRFPCGLSCRLLTGERVMVAVVKL
jgi:hypothetical protein